ncbi:MAG: sulfatase-like hydrolase/transferase [Eubacteriales bacterium]
MKKKPNILFIMTDQQRHDTFGLNNSVIKTPNLDQLIQESVFFENARCTNPSCVPSRAAIMTGKMPSECQCPAYITELPPDEVTFMSRLQEEGYHTCVIGKQHFADSKIEYGYDEQTIIDGHGAFAPPQTIAPYLRYLADHKTSPREVYKKTCISGGEWLVEEKLHIDNFIGDLGVEWVKKQDKSNEKPWFFTLSFSGPHHPYDLEGTKYSDMYDLADMNPPESNYEDLDQKPPQYKNMNMYSKIYLKDHSDEQYRKSKRAYYANMTLMDEKIGEVIEELKKKDLYEDTVIIFTTDHGDFLGDHGLMEKLQCLSDGLMRVPLFIKPGNKNAKFKKIEDPVLNVDIAATCLEIAGGKVPDSLSNYSYTGYFDENFPVKVRPEVYMEAGGIRGVVFDDLKVISYVDREYGELYDLKNDPLERINLWNNPDFTTTKMIGLQRIINHLYKAIPKHEIPWNHGTPEI